MHLSRRDRLRDIEMDQFFDRTWDYEPPTWLERGYYPPHLPPYAERYNYPYFPQYGFNPLEEPGFDPRLPPHYPYLDPPPRDYFGFRPPDDFEGDLAEALQSPARDGLRPVSYTHLTLPTIYSV
eukprot:TRINITY_DN3753_c0_g1_i5.p1 TRINITY_DN3753_c0_g1~~TRINITY_DN3753_c0_g1_i5.p1  ORF type:complete len:124 (-),score=11.98 TRINITY_DN3753_c0_g1_i5:35-406(-)